MKICAISQFAKSFRLNFLNTPQNLCFHIGFQHVWGILVPYRRHVSSKHPNTTVPNPMDYHGLSWIIIMFSIYDRHLAAQNVTIFHRNHFYFHRYPLKVSMVWSVRLISIVSRCVLRFQTGCLHNGYVIYTSRCVLHFQTGCVLYTVEYLRIDFFYLSSKTSTVFSRPPRGTFPGYDHAGDAQRVTWRCDVAIFQP